MCLSHSLIEIVGLPLGGKRSSVRILGPGAYRSLGLLDALGSVHSSLSLVLEQSCDNSQSLHSADKEMETWASICVQVSGHDRECLEGAVPLSQEGDQLC